jgi:uncharacterized protein (DUF4415 family)
MKKQERIVRKSFDELANRPPSPRPRREFTEEEIERMAREDGTEDLDFSDALFVDIEELVRLTQSKRKKQAISIRLDPDVLDWYKSYGQGYQTFIGDLLAAYMKTRKEPPRRAG